MCILLLTIGAIVFSFTNNGSATIWALCIEIILLLVMGIYRKVQYHERINTLYLKEQNRRSILKTILREEFKITEKSKLQEIILMLDEEIAQETMFVKALKLIIQIGVTVILPVVVGIVSNQSLFDKNGLINFFIWICAGALFCVGANITIDAINGIFSRKSKLIKLRKMLRIVSIYWD